MKVVPDDILETVCLMGKGAKCCRFLVVNEEGICCAKNSDFHNIINYRARKTTMIAKGDNCEGI